MVGNQSTDESRSILFFGVNSNKLNLSVTDFFLISAVDYLDRLSPISIIIISVDDFLYSTENSDSRPNFFWHQLLTETHVTDRTDYLSYLRNIEQDVISTQHLVSDKKDKFCEIANIFSFKNVIHESNIWLSILSSCVEK